MLIKKSVVNGRPLPLGIKTLTRQARDIYRARHMLWEITLAQLKAKYSISSLGIWIAILNPLLVMLAISFVFTKVIRLEIENFPLFALAGIFPWLFFSTAVSETTFSLVNQRSTLRQFNMPKEIIPLSTVLSNFLSFLIGWCAIYPIFVVFKPTTILFLPLLIVGFLLIFFFVCGLGIMLTALNTLSGDVGQLLGVLLMLWFWLTPIFYAPNMIPLNFRWLCYLNPMTFFTIFYRDILFRATMPHGYILLAIFVLSALSLIAGLSVFSFFRDKISKKI